MAEVVDGHKTRTGDWLGLFIRMGMRLGMAGNTYEARAGYEHKDKAAGIELGITWGWCLG